MIGRLLGIVIAGVSAAFLSQAAWSQGWKPQRNVELIVPAGAGGSLDTTGCTVHKIWIDLKLVPTTSTIVVNRCGGGHAIAYGFLNQHAGDPHCLSITSATLLTNRINGRLAHSKASRRFSVS